MYIYIYAIPVVFYLESPFLDHDVITNDYETFNPRTNHQPTEVDRSPCSDHWIWVNYNNQEFTNLKFSATKGDDFPSINYDFK